MSKDREVTILAVGDFNLNRDNPETSFTHTAPLLRSADIAFGQLEVALTDRPCPQVQQPSECFVPARNVCGVTYAGLSIISFAGNHTMDAGLTGFTDTVDILKKNNIEVVGVGKDLEEAGRPVILERKGTKIGFFAYNSILPVGYAAGPDTPGCNPIRISTFYEPIDAQPGTKPRILTVPNEQDMKAMDKAIRALKANVDVVMVSMHWGIHFEPAILAGYQRVVGHAAIDAGADLIIGSHPHILKGVEVYKGKAIFYSLCNFGMDSFLPRKLNTPRVKQLFSLYKFQPDPEYPTYPYHPDARKSMIAKCTIVDKRIARVSYIPICINKQSQPELLPHEDKRRNEVFEYVEWCCKDQELEAKFTWDGDEVVISGAI